MDTSIVGKNAQGQDINQFKQPVIDCATGCGRKTTMTGTRLCDFCWHAKSFFDLTPEAQEGLRRYVEARKS